MHFLLKMRGTQVDHAAHVRVRPLMQEGEALFEILFIQIKVGKGAIGGLVKGSKNTKPGFWSRVI